MIDLLAHPLEECNSSAREKFHPLTTQEKNKQKSQSNSERLRKLTQEDIGTSSPFEVNRQILKNFGRKKNLPPPRSSLPDNTENFTQRIKSKFCSSNTQRINQFPIEIFQGGIDENSNIPELQQDIVEMEDEFTSEFLKRNVLDTEELTIRSSVFSRFAVMSISCSEMVLEKFLLLFQIMREYNIMHEIEQDIIRLFLPKGWKANRFFSLQSRLESLQIPFSLKTNVISKR